MSGRPQLICCDVDGTLLDDRERIPADVRAVIRRAVSAGAQFALATGRPPRWIAPVLEQLDLYPICVCANGAIVYDSATDTMLDVAALAPDTLCQVVEIATRGLAPFGGASFAVERSGDSAWADESELFLVSPDYVPAWVSEGHATAPLAQLCSHPAIKLLIRNEQLTSAQIFDVLAPLIPGELAHTTFSIPDGLVEVSAPGVTKARGVAYIAASIGVAAADVVAFGDMPNDCDMLRWAGFGVAMANAVPEVQEAADSVTRSNNDSGVAAVLERWF
ncbi:Cof-type HAD-IIB family hydrolase [Corynebacterium epidermidicanis]|uniref:Putative HAD superfamily hydrolase n=1 Tax=Corynebacterium epidermidicanis TaxID=1050174 RepID=A0A0G3GST5_9CORY|nr:Cof-type HAD-IIB family hydrolase [Corynebacterium epidermidicanis]AKK04169.1 putative HAD superfamily hydrolase [Corynebacterium epidermidicanis]